ncbi:MAG: DUF6311 domain-containing protein [Lachnospiraceae bacterium]|nr:DUF6311 domain-containing protein [Lachnospiraceae bacterium]
MTKENNSVLSKLNNLLRIPGVTFLWGVTVGVVTFLLLYGVAVLNPVNVNWLRHSNDLEGLWDLSQHYLGWVAYRNSPWTFPIGMTEGITAEPISVVYTDSIPLFALFFKVISPLLPESFQYFGLFELLCYGLTGGFGALISARFAHHPLLSFASALFFVTSPVLTKRVFYHSALSAHFLILAALCLWMYRAYFTPKRQGYLWVLLTVLATVINAYYVPMVLGFLCMEVMQEHLAQRNMRLSPFVPVLSGTASLLTGWILGMFGGRVSVAAENLENVSFDLFGFFNSRNDVLKHVLTMPLYEFVGAEDYSRFLPGFQTFTPWQSEGFSYVGLGMLGLMLFVCVYFFASKHSPDETKIMRSYLISISIGVVGFTFLAVGPRVTAGGKVLFTIPWPEGIYRLLSVFRTTGRLIWPVYYGLMTLAIIGITCIYLQSRQRRLLVLVGALLCLQLYDISPSLAHKHAIYAHIGEEAYENPLLKEEIFSDAAKDKSEILFVSPTRAIALRPYWSTLLEDYALENGMKMNAAYCSRDITASADAYADAHIARLRAGDPTSTVLYIFLTEDILDEYRDLPLKISPYEDIFIGTYRE